MIGLFLAVALGAGIGTNHVAAVESRLAQSRDQVPTCLSRFVAYDATAASGRFQLNTNFWLKGIDFTCVSPWNSAGGRRRAGTAISRRHIVFAKHFPLPVGTRIAFVGETGEVSHYSVRATKVLASCDIMIGLLDYELTPDIHPAKVVSADFVNRFDPKTVWPVVTFNQHEQVFLSEMTFCWIEVLKETICINETPKNPSWRRFAREIAIGDSGNPAFLLYGDQPILLYCVFGGRAGNGPVIGLSGREVQQAMDALCPGYKLESYSEKP